MTEPWTHHVRMVNGFRMHYVIAGSGAPLVLLHGWPQSWYEWRKVIPALEVKRRLTRVTAGEIRAVARDFFRPERLNLALVSPLKSENAPVKLLKF